MINFAIRYWVALDQQKATPSEKEFGSEIKWQDAYSHQNKQLEKIERQISKIEQFKQWWWSRRQDTYNPVFRKSWSPGSMSPL